VTVPVLLEKLHTVPYLVPTHAIVLVTNQSVNHVPSTVENVKTETLTNVQLVLETELMPVPVTVQMVLMKMIPQPKHVNHVTIDVLNVKTTHSTNVNLVTTHTSYLTLPVPLVLNVNNKSDSSVIKKTMNALHVPFNVRLVLILPLNVLNVTHQESMPQNVDVQMVSGKKIPSQLEMLCVTTKSEVMMEPVHYVPITVKLVTMLKLV
jgi:hypothetical protein